VRKATLTRKETGDQGTFGLLVTDRGFSCVTGELPWRDLDGNGIGDSRTSCVTPGTYTCRWAYSPAFGFWLYRLEGVVGREGILIHTGNFVGDKAKNFRSDVLGCILVGKKLGTGHNQKMVQESRDALAALIAHFDRQPFELKIIEQWVPTADR
jgi:hypothetical protein